MLLQASCSIRAKVTTMRIRNGSAVRMTLNLGALLTSLSMMFAQGITVQRQVAPVTSSSSELMANNHGTYYALVIGIANYQHLPKLATPVNDATEVEKILRDTYGFHARLLLDATRDQIIEALDKDKHSLGPDDNLLIYYAGHGFYDKPEDQAYWAPVDAGQDTYARWIIATEITSRARAIAARHVLVVSDSCYSGQIAGRAADLRDGVADVRDPYLARMLEQASRNLLASGGNEPVSDSDTPGHGNHSVFANALLRGLKEMSFARFSASELFDQYIRVQVPGRSRQMPQYTAIRDSGHDGGDFVFVRNGEGLVQATTAEQISLPPPSANPEEEAIHVTLNRYEEAYASMDIDLLKQVWPTLSRNQVRGLRSGFDGAKAVMVELRSPAITLAGDTAVVKADQWMKWTRAGHQQPPQANSVEIQLRKVAGGNWLVDGVKAQ